ncbi:multidrug and toxin extrusion 2-like, partial [Brachionus plicatilis]
MDPQTSNAESKRCSIKKRTCLLFADGFRQETLLLIKNSIPLIFNNFSQTFLPIVSLFFCGHIGPNELAAVTLANTFINIGSFSTLVGLSSACDTLFPQLFGGMDKKKLGSVLQKAIILSILSCLPTCGILLNVKNIMALFIREKIIIQLADRYIVIFLPSILFYSIYIILQKYVLSQNIFYPILYINIVVNLLNVAFHGFFISYLGLGIDGGAISVVLSIFLNLTFLLLYIWMSKLYQQTWSGWKIDCLYDWNDYLKLALPGFAMLFFEWTNFEIGVIASGKLGRDQISVMSIGIQTIYIAFMIPLGIATAANIRIGQLLGQNLPSKAKYSCKIGFLIAFASSLMTGMTILIFSNHIPLAFTKDPFIIKNTTSQLKFIAFAHLLDALQGYGGGVLKATGLQFYGFLMVTLSFYGVGIPVGIYLLLKTDFQVTGYWMGFVTAAIILLVMQGLFIHRIDWIKNAQKAFDRSLEKPFKSATSELRDVNEAHEMVLQKPSKKNLIEKISICLTLFGIFVCLLLSRNLVR